MRKFLFNLVIIAVLIVTFYAFKRSEKTFEATFKHIDGLPTGAPVSALGTRIGKVLKTTPVDDGVKVTVGITNKQIPPPPPGSLLTITSYKPGQAKVLEIIPPSSAMEDTRAWLTREPITTESWLIATLELWDGLKNFSQTALQYLTSENVTKVRTSIAGAADTLSATAENIRRYEAELGRITEHLSLKANEANQLVTNLKQSIGSLNSILTEKQIDLYLKDNIGEFSSNVDAIKNAVQNPGFITKVADVKSEILDQLNQTNSILREARGNIKDPEMLKSINEFNNHVVKLNVFYDELAKKEVTKVAKKKIEQIKETATAASNQTAKLIQKLDAKQN